jgi:hypothetical protein
LPQELAKGRWSGASTCSSVMGISQGLNGAEVIGNPQITKRFLL